jgi:murein DD-endopeptidase MepM/ murein hydrolase activator NlpD
MKAALAAALAAMAACAPAAPKSVAVMPPPTTRAPAIPAARPVAPPIPEPFEAALSLCPGMTVSNAPDAGPDRAVLNYRRDVTINGVRLAANPTIGACLSSGFGMRNGREHRGVDYYRRDGGPIFAAADGVVREQIYRNDYGNMIVLDHGAGVFTRYAHLASFAEGLAVGATVRRGAIIGQMGNTASYTIPVHLHYEILTGDYETPRGSFGLEARSPFAAGDP